MTPFAARQRDTGAVLSTELTPIAPGAIDRPIFGLRRVARTDSVSTTDRLHFSETGAAMQREIAHLNDVLRWTPQPLGCACTHLTSELAMRRDCAARRVGKLTRAIWWNPSSKGDCVQKWTILERWSPLKTLVRCDIMRTGICLLFPTSGIEWSFRYQNPKYQPLLGLTHSRPWDIFHFYKCIPNHLLCLKPPWSI